MKSIYTDIVAERAAQFRKWGHQHYTPERWLAILLEEIGEAAEQVVIGGFPDQSPDTLTAAKISLEQELIQVAAVVVAWLEDIDRAATETPPRNGLRGMDGRSAQQPREGDVRHTTVAEIMRSHGVEPPETPQ